MTDPRYLKLAKLLVNYSTQVKKGDRVLLDMIDVPDEFSIELMRAVRAADGTPLVEVRHTRITREIVRETNAKTRRTAPRPGAVPHEKNAGVYCDSRQFERERNRRCAR